MLMPRISEIRRRQVPYCRNSDVLFHRGTGTVARSFLCPMSLRMTHSVILALNHVVEMKECLNSQPSAAEITLSRFRQTRTIAFGSWCTADHERLARRFGTTIWLVGKMPEAGFARSTPDQLKVANIFMMLPTHVVLLTHRVERWQQKSARCSLEHYKCRFAGTPSSPPTTTTSRSKTMPDAASGYIEKV